jgi:hypothetical protein
MANHWSDDDYDDDDYDDDKANSIVIKNLSTGDKKALEKHLKKISQTQEDEIKFLKKKHEEELREKVNDWITYKRTQTVNKWAKTYYCTSVCTDSYPKQCKCLPTLKKSKEYCTPECYAGSTDCCICFEFPSKIPETCTEACYNSVFSWCICWRMSIKCNACDRTHRRKKLFDGSLQKVCPFCKQDPLSKDRPICSKCKDHRRISKREMRKSIEKRRCDDCKAK